MARTAQVACAAAAATLLVACGGGSDPQGGCVSGQACDPGKACAVGSTACESATSTPTCAVVGAMLDGTACGDGQVCASGACTASGLTCQSGLTACGATCVDVATDTSNCGACGTVCTSGYRCSSGACALSCQIGLTECGGTCVNLAIDSSNCGGCGVACTADQTCSSGTCAARPAVCAAGQTYCPTASIYTDRPPGCYDLATTWNACGTCDAMPCRESWDGSSHQPGRCENGVCATAPLCPAGQTYCPTASIYTDRPPGCYDLATTWNACGSCDAMPCRQSWDGSSHQPGRCENGVCATTP